MTVLYAGGRIFDGRGQMRDDHGVMVDGRQIQSVAPLAEFEGYQGARVDTSGATFSRVRASASDGWQQACKGVEV